MPVPASLILALLLGLTAAAARGVPPAELEGRIASAFEDGAYRRAADLIESYLAGEPDDVTMLYNAACAYCRLGSLERSAEYLLRAVKAGFVDFEFMGRDPDLAGLRRHPTFTAIMEAAERVAARAGPSALERWRDRFGTDGYRYETDDARRLAYATALDEVSHRQMRRMLERQADQLVESLFEAPPEKVILIAVPKPADGAELFNGDDQTGGIYLHGARRLIARDIGSPLRHEFVHALHYGHMERLGQAHPIWIQEGLAALYETYELDDDGAIRFLPNQRHNLVRRRARAGLLMPWSRLMDLSSGDFMRGAGHLYPQVRSIFEYLAEQGHLHGWYRAFVAQFGEDPSGARAMEITFDQPLEETERAWRRWVLDRPELDVTIGLGDAALGIQSEPRASNDGVLVTGVLRGSAADGAGVRRRDVIVAVDGRPTRSLLELQSVIATRRVGERVQVRLRRKDEYLDLTMTLRPLLPAR
jgi:hypothetical protein